MQRFKNIVLFCDHSLTDDPATSRAVELALVNGASLHIVDVLTMKPLTRSLKSFSERFETMQKELVEERRKELETLFQYYAERLSITFEVLIGKPFIELIHYVQRNRCDLVIKSVGEEKRISSVFFGSTDLRLLRKCPCPVWMVKRDEQAKSRKILAAIELEALEDDETLDQLNSQIIEIATSMAIREDCELHFVNAWIVFDGAGLAKKFSKHYEDDVSSWKSEQKKQIEQNQEVFVNFFEKFRDENGLGELKSQFHFLEGEAEHVIVDFAEREEIDIVIMGTVARTDLAGFFVGNTSEAVLNQITCSVLAVKPPGFISPLFLKNDGKDN